MEPIFLEAVCKDYIWGGNQLRERFGKKSTADRIAESWELSAILYNKSIMKRIII